jgi:pilus assembly protein CpaB
MLREEQVELTARAETAFQDAGLVVGQIARRDIVAGAQITAADFTTTSGTLTVKTPVGLRAMAVQVDQVSGVGTLINPGDYVDLIVGFTGEKFPVITLNPEAETAGEFTVLTGINQTTVKILVPGVQVLGTLVPPPVAGAAPAPGATPAPALTGQQQIVIVAVSAQQTEIIKFSQMDGSITLVLRSPDDFKDEAGNPVVPGAPETSGIILRTLVEEYGVLVPELIETILPAQPAPPVQESPSP